MLAAICDDEKVCIKNLEGVLRRVEQINTIHCYERQSDLCASIEDGTVYDIIFMDIDWKDERRNGIDLAGELKNICPNTQIIFVTAYNDRFSQHIFLKAVNLCGYLVKPVKYELVEQLVIKAEEALSSYREQQLVIQRKGEVRAIPYQSILYIESCKHQCEIHTEDGLVTVYEKLVTLKSRLPVYFEQCHQSYLINLSKVKRIEKKEVILCDDSVLFISKAKFTEFRKAYFTYLGDSL